MAAADIDALRDWVEQALKGYPDPLVPLPPNARIDIRALGPTEIDPLTENGIRTGVETHYRHFVITLIFGKYEKTEIVRSSAWHLRRAAQADLTLGGRVEHGSVPLDDTDREDLARVEPRLVDDSWVVRIPVTLQKDFSQA